MVYPHVRRLEQGVFMLAQLPPALQNLHLPLRLRLWDGHEFNLGPAPSVTIVVKDPQMVSQLSHPSLDALGAAFVEGKLELEGSISEVIRVCDELSSAWLHSSHTRITSLIEPSSSSLPSTKAAPSRSRLGWSGALRGT